MNAGPLFVGWFGYGVVAFMSFVAIAAVLPSEHKFRPDPQSPQLCATCGRRKDCHVR